MTLWRPSDGSNANTDAMAAQMGALIEEMKQKGVLIETGGWDPHGPSTMLTYRSGVTSVTDGPHTETKELIAGFAIVEVPSYDEAIVWSKKFLQIAGEGTTELRALWQGE